MQSPAPAAPGGYRPVQESDLAVGKSVVYVSRAADGHQLATRVEDAVIIQDRQLGPCIRLQHKHLAQMSRVFARETTAAVGEDVMDGIMDVGAPGVVAPTTPRSDTINDVTSNDVNVFLKCHVAPWIESMAKDAQEKEVTLPEVLNERLTSFLKTHHGEPLASPFEDLVVMYMRQAVLEKAGYVNFMVVPKTTKKGYIHVSMLAFQKTSYAGFGMFVSDAQVLLDGEGFEGLVRKTISIKPRAGIRLRDLGWEPDGAVINSTLAFALTSIAVYSITKEVDLPQPLAQHLSAIPVQYTNYGFTILRLYEFTIGDFEPYMARHLNHMARHLNHMTRHLNHMARHLNHINGAALDPYDI